MAEGIHDDHQTDRNPASDPGAAADPGGTAPDPAPYRPSPYPSPANTGGYRGGDYGNGGYGQRSGLHGEHRSSSDPWAAPSWPAGYPGSGQPGGTPPPAAGYPAAAVTPAPRPRRGRAAAAATAVVVAATVGGGAGAVLEHHYRGDATPVVSSLESPPPASNVANTAPAGSVEQVAASVLPSVASITVATQGGGDEGTGIVLSSDGKILTNNHVVEAGTNGRGAISVTFKNGKTVKATILGRDTVTDLAVVKAAGVSGLTPARLGSSSGLSVGQSVVAIGSPLGLSGSVTSGILSSLNRPVQTASSEGQGQQGQGGGPSQAPAAQATVIDAIQTDAAINPGNSGGPLVDMKGRVIGINSAIASLGSSGGSAGQSGSIGLGFAIPIDEARPIVGQLAAGEQATHAQLGVTAQDTSGQTGVGHGAALHTVGDGSGAAKAGLHQGDVVTKLDSRVIDGSDALVAAVRAHRPGDGVTVTYTRGAGTHTAKVTLGSDH